MDGVVSAKKMSDKSSSNKSPGSQLSHAGLNCSPRKYLGMKFMIGSAQMLHRVVVSTAIVEVGDWRREQDSDSFTF